MSVFYTNTTIVETDTERSLLSFQLTVKSNRRLSMKCLESFLIVK